MGDNLQKINKDKAWLIEQLKKHNLTPKESLIVVLNGDGSLYYQKKKSKH